MSEYHTDTSDDFSDDFFDEPPRKKAKRRIKKVAIARPSHIPRGRYSNAITIFDGSPTASMLTDGCSLPLQPWKAAEATFVQYPPCAPCTGFFQQRSGMLVR